MREHIGRVRSRIEKQQSRVVTEESLRGLFREELGRRSSREEFELLRSGLIWEGILHPMALVGERETVYTVFRQTVSAEDVICGVNGYAAISHLSAMTFHQLTDRLPTTCFYTVGGGSLFGLSRDSFRWKEHSRLGPKKHGETRFVRVTTKNALRVIHLDDQVVRFTTVGQTLLDMLRKPELCGGIGHVLEVFDDQGALWVKELVEEVEASGGPIDKVRAGYVIDERLGVDHPILATWESYAARGGSRKLCADRPYSGRFSERWCLSLNQAGN